MMRRLLGRLRMSRASVLYHRLDGTSEDDGRPWMIAFADTRDEGARQERTELVGAERTEIAAAERTETLPETAPESAPPTDSEPVSESVRDIAPLGVTATESDPGLVPALNRVADAFERMAASLEIEHREREVRLASVEQLLRELVTGLGQPTAVPPVVLGGSISAEMLQGHSDDAAEIDLSDPQLELEGSDDSPPGAP